MNVISLPVNADFGDLTKLISMVPSLEKLTVSVTRLQRSHLFGILCSFYAASYMANSLWKLLVVPEHLRHIPKVNSLSWFWSILMGESHDVRIKKLMLPLIAEHGLCLKYILGRWTVTVGDPVLLQKLLKDVYTYPKEGVTMDKDLVLTNQEPNMGNANYAVWKRQRSIANPVFHRAMPVETFGQIAKRMFDSIDKHNQDGVIDAADYMRRYALDCLGLGIFDFDMEAVTDPNSLYATIYKEAFSIVRDPFVYLFPAYARIPSRYIPYRNRARLANENLRRILANIIAERKQAIEEGNHNDDLLSLMIMAANGHTDVANAYLTDGELVSNLAVFFVAGHETTASATASFIYYLAANPEKQVKAREEVLSVLGDEPEDVLPTEAELKQMTYLNNCIMETMRINPPTSGNLPRIVTKDTLLGNYLIPKDTRVALELYCVHHLDKYWEDPSVFNPDRFNKDHPSYRSQAVWMPFGDGPRTCVGRNFSLQEQRVLQAMLLKRYTWKLAPRSEHQDGLKNAKGGGIGLLGPETMYIQLIRRYDDN